jgi:hypothetical protein
MSKSETVTIAAIEGRVPLLVQAREIIAAFRAMIRQKSYRDDWLERAPHASHVARAGSCRLSSRAVVGGRSTSM